MWLLRSFWMLQIPRKSRKATLVSKWYIISIHHSLLYNMALRQALRKLANFKHICVMYICVYIILYIHIFIAMFIYMHICQLILTYEKSRQRQLNKLYLRISQKLIFKDEVLTQINFYLCKNKLFVEEQTWGYPKYPYNLKSKPIDFKGIFG